MAMNPMQKKSMISFLLGAVLMLVLGAIVIVFLIMQIKEKDKKIAQFTANQSNVYVLNRDVKSGQVLTPDMFSFTRISNSVRPANATTDIITTLASYSLSSTSGIPVGIDDAQGYYYCKIGENKYPIYILDSQGNEVAAKAYEVADGADGKKIYTKTSIELKAKDPAYYYENNQRLPANKKEITIAENAVIAKLDMQANTIITSDLIARANETTTNDLRKMEYNIISLPVELEPKDYVDIRLTLPTGESYIVLSKKQIGIPVVNGAYSPDTISMKLNEEEILMLSSAIIENFKIDGSELAAVKYAEPGNQTAAAITYYPTDEVKNLLNNDANAVQVAIKGIEARRNAIREGINKATNKYGNEDNVPTKIEESRTTTIEERQRYLQTLVVTTY